MAVPAHVEAWLVFLWLGHTHGCRMQYCPMSLPIKPWIIFSTIGKKRMKRFFWKIHALVYFWYKTQGCLFVLLRFESLETGLHLFVQPLTSYIHMRQTTRRYMSTFICAGTKKIRGTFWHFIGMKVSQCSFGSYCALWQTFLRRRSISKRQFCKQDQLYI